jgi:hypothetical protein
MKIPSYQNTRAVDENGYFTPEWKRILNQLFNELQTQMSNESHIVPHQSTAKIALLNGTKYIGGNLYNFETHKAVVNINGTFKEILTT